MTCHEDNCPALCQFGRTMACDHYNVKRLLVNHECRCQGPALLKELLDAATLAAAGPDDEDEEPSWQELGERFSILKSVLTRFKTHSTIDPVSTISLEPP